MATQRPQQQALAASRRRGAGMTETSKLRDGIEEALAELREKVTGLRREVESDPNTGIQTRIKLGTMAGLTEAIVRIQRALDEDENA